MKTTTQHDAPNASRTDAPHARASLFVLFTLDNERYVIDAAQIERLMPLSPDTPPKPIPGAPAWVAGIIEFHGAPLPVIDLPALALGRPAKQRMSTRMVLVRYPHRTASSDTRPLALLLEGATRTLRIDASAFHDAGIDLPNTRYLGPVARIDSGANGLVQWIRVEHLLPDDVKALLFTEPSA